MLHHFWCLIDIQTTGHCMIIYSIFICIMEAWPIFTKVDTFWLKWASRGNGNLPGHQLWRPESVDANLSTPRRQRISSFITSAVTALDGVWASENRSFSPKISSLQPFPFFRGDCRRPAAQSSQVASGVWGGGLRSLHQLSISLECKGISNLSKPQDNKPPFLLILAVFVAFYHLRQRIRFPQIHFF